METLTKEKKNGTASKADAKAATKKTTAKKTTAKSPKEISLPELDFRQVIFEIEGIAPLIVNNFSEKSKKQMLDKQMKKATKGREAKNPEEQYLGSLYRFDPKDVKGKKTGIPAVALKAAMTRAGKQLGMAMTDTRGKFHVLSEEGSDLLEIKGKHSMREDMVRVANGAADIRYRGEYKKWKIKVPITYNAGVISEEQLASLLNAAGFSCGLGEWRPEKSNSGSYGLFRVV